MNDPIIQPFQALHFNREKFKNYGKIICPPYDIIDAFMEKKLRKSSLYNFIHILLKNNRNDYPTIGKRFRLWCERNILVEEQKEAIYLCKQEFVFQKKRMTRYGFLALLRLDSENSVFPHEFTHQRPKEDRLKILEELKANLSPVFIVYPEQKSSTSYKNLRSLLKQKPFLKFTSTTGITYTIWQETQSKRIAKVIDSLQKRNMLIADGHHRFEVAKTFYQKYRSTGHGFKKLNYVLAYFCPAIKENILVLPTHRTIQHASVSLEYLREKMSDLFSVTRYKTMPQLLGALQQEKKLSIGFFGHNEYALLTLQNQKALDTIIGTENQAYRELNVFMLHKLILPRLGITVDETNIFYTIDAYRAQAQAKKTQGCSFFLNALTPEHIMKIAFQKNRLPQKSTYFFPKIDSGILARKL